MPTLLLAYIVLILGSCSNSSTKTFHATASKIQDGDSFEVLKSDHSSARIRLYGIDCPERGQDFSKVAKTKLGEMLQNKTLTIHPRDTDSYGRTVAIVYADTVCVNEALLRAGLAWHFTRYDKNPRWSQFEQDARKANLGLWSMTHPIAPWKWRADRRSKRKS